MDHLYLRLSITDRCNLRCIYCMPEEGVRLVDHRDLLSYEEMLRVARVLSGLAPLKKVRVTGGEPLVRKGAIGLVSMLSKSLPGAEICMTTNGSILAPSARALKEAGLSRINVSLDSLEPERYRELTRGGELANVLAGIRAATDAGLSPIKVNCVLLAGLNDSEAGRFVEFAMDEGVEVRFLELMPIGQASEAIDHGRFASAADVFRRISESFDLHFIRNAGTSAEYEARRDGKIARIGLITPMTDPFCDRCDRVRLDSRGRLYPCLFSEKFVDAAALIRAGASDSDLDNAIREAFAAKSRPTIAHSAKRMSTVGG